MVLLNQVAALVMYGNTHANLAAIKATGATWDNGAKLWRLNVERHPMNNVKQRKRLEKMLTDLEERGVQFTYYDLNGSMR